MRMINGRYRIVREIYDDFSTLKSFLVLDLWNDDMPLCLTLVDRKRVPDSVFDFLRDNLLQISAVHNEFYLKNIGFSNVVSINGRKRDKRLFLYTSEFLGWKVPLPEYVHGQGLDTLLNVIIQICQAGSFAVMTGFLFFTTLPEDYFITVDSEGDMHLKIRDFFSIELNRAGGAGDLDYAYESGFFDSINLGMLFLKLFEGYSSTRGNLENIEFIKSIYSLKQLDEKDVKIFDVLITVTEKLISDEYSRFEHIFYDIFADINKALDTKFVPHSTYSKNLICNRPKLVSFNNDVARVLNNFRNFNNCENFVRTFIVKGCEGSGKTRFLQEVAFTLSIEKSQIFEFDMQEKTGFFFWLSFLNLIFTDEPSIGDEYDLKSLIQDLKNLNSADDDFEAQKNRLIFIFTSIVQKLGRKEPVTILLDNFHVADDFTVDVFLSLIINHSNSDKLILILSINSLYSLRRKKLRFFEEKVLTSDDARIMHLNNLDEFETSELVKNFLLMSFRPIILSKALYRLTGGNPRFIISMLEDLMSKNVLFKNDDDIVWFVVNSIYNMSTLIDSSKCILPYADKQFKFIDYRKNEFLQVFSIFNKFFKKKVLYGMLSKYSKKEIDEKFNEFFENGHIKNIYDDVYTFDDKIFRVWVYESIDDEEKTRLHNLVVDVLLDEDSIESVEEAVFHLEVMSRKKEAMVLYLRLGRYYSANSSYRESAFFYEKALSLSDNKEDVLAFEILLETATAHFQIGNIKETVYFLEEAGELLEKVESSDLTIRYHLSLANVSYAMGENSQLKSSLKKLEKKTREFKNKSELLEYQILLAIDDIDSGNIENAHFLLIKVIDDCGNHEDLQKLKVTAIRLLGNCYFFANDVDEALKKYTETYDEAERLDDYQGLLEALNNTAYVYSTVLGDYDKGLLQYEKIARLAQEHGLSSVESKALLDIARICIFQDKLELAEKYGYKGFQKVMLNTVETDKHVFFATLLLYVIEARKKNYISAKKYYDNLMRVKKDTEVTKLNSKQFIDFYSIVADFKADFGDYKDAMQVLEEGKKFIYDFNTTSDVIIKFKVELFEVLSFRKKSLKKLIKLLNESKSVLLKHDQNTIVRSSSLAIAQLILQNQFQHIKDFAVEFLEFCGSDFNFSVVNRVCFNLIKTYIDEENEEKYLLNSLNDLSIFENIFLKIVVNIKLGIYYINKSKIGLGVLNLLEAQDLIFKIMDNIHDNEKQKFFNFNSYKVPFALVYQYIRTENIIIEPSLFNEKVSGVGLKKLLNSKDRDVLLRKNVFINTVVKDSNQFNHLKYTSLKRTISQFSQDPEDNIQKMLQLMRSKLFANTSMLVKYTSEERYLLLFSDADVDKALNKQLLTFLNDEGLSGLEDLGLKLGVKFLVLPLNESEIYGENGSVYIIFAIKNIFFSLSKKRLSFCRNQRNIIVFLLDVYNKKRLSSIDPCTGAISVKYFKKYIAELFTKTDEKHSGVSIVFFAIDNLNNIRKEYGWIAVNNILKTIVGMSEKILDKNQAIGHYGSDSFILALQGVGVQSAFNKVKKLKEMIAKYSFPKVRETITITSGIAIYPGDAISPDGVIQKAVKAFNFAKKIGDNSSAIWEESLDRTVLMTNDLCDLLVYDIDKMHSLIELLSYSVNYESKASMLKTFLTTVLEIFSANNALLIYDYDKAEKKHIVETNAGISESQVYSRLDPKYIERIETTKYGLYDLNWENTFIDDAGVPVWTSILIAPVFYNTKMKGVIYLDANAKIKQFDCEDLNYLSTLSMIIAKEL
ncbi:MAG: hypothetical protein CR988_01165 [Treponema sp.]|nr:MAG: hypothetical protein CR988_01165 [Treponema sp.]